MTTELPESADVVVIGAGHNGLICAAYLAQAGLEVCVLEARDIVGGNTVTEELTLPGFQHDSCSSAHVLIQSNPVIADDELGLLSTYGLKYVYTDPAVVMPLPGGEAIVVHRDLDATVDELARFSAEDASEFRAMVREWDGGLARAHGRWNAGEPPADDEATKQYDDLRARSAWDVVHSRFSHPVVRDLLLWLGFATIQDPRRPGTGALPSAITSGRLKFGWATPIGGSGALPASLVRHIEDHGGTVAADAPVSRIDTSEGRASGVGTADGRRVAARRAVVSSAHLASLAGMVTDPTPDLVEACDAWRPGLSLFAVHAALKSDLTFPTSKGPLSSVAGGLGTASGLEAQLEAFKRGEPDARDPWMLLVASTVVDRERAPDGGGTFKILTVAPNERADGRSWDESGSEHAAALMDRVHERTGVPRDDVLQMVAETPTSLAERNPHNVGGSCHGGEFVTSDGDVIPGWTSYRASIPGLFLTGSTAHPGGSVSGRPGRNAARAVLHRARGAARTVAEGS
ncbi:MAG: phytoene desaturase family protein [Actinomycetes bacterium]